MFLCWHCCASSASSHSPPAPLSGPWPQSWSCPCNMTWLCSNHDLLVGNLTMTKNAPGNVSDNYVPDRYICPKRGYPRHITWLPGYPLCTCIVHIAVAMSLVIFLTITHYLVTSLVMSLTMTASEVRKHLSTSLSSSQRQMISELKRTLGKCSKCNGFGFNNFGWQKKCGFI